MDERAVREYLLRHDERFRELFDEHQQFEETVLKKKKLALKDRMQHLIQEYRVQHPVH